MATQHAGSAAVELQIPPPSSLKRKRDAEDNCGYSKRDRIPQPPPPRSGQGATISYLIPSGDDSRLRLLPADGEAFADVLSLISDYEGVLGRHESLAAKLGARLTAPRLLRALEGMFEAPATVTPASPHTRAPSWLEIAELARTKPADFSHLTTLADGRRVCQFTLNGLGVEIGEDDWRVIVSGALDRFFCLAQPLDEDEMAELATLDIIDKRLQILIKKADEVAGKAPRLNYHLSGRKDSIAKRRSCPVPEQSPAQLYDLHADLLQQFLAPLPTSSDKARPTPTPTPTPTVPRHPPPSLSRHSTTSAARQPGSSAPASPCTTVLAHTPPLGAEVADDSSRATIQLRIEKLQRGATILPPCDRCRRLRLTCQKHLTACQACTKKHAKCSWRQVTDEEMAALRADVGQQQDGGHQRAQQACQSDDVATGVTGLTGLTGVTGEAGPSMMSQAGSQAGNAVKYGPSVYLGGGQRSLSGSGGAKDVSDQHEQQQQQQHGPRLLIPHLGSRERGPSLSQPFTLSHMASIASAAAEARAETRESSESSVVARDQEDQGG